MLCIAGCAIFSHDLLSTRDEAAMFDPCRHNFPGRIETRAPQLLPQAAVDTNVTSNQSGIPENSISGGQESCEENRSGSFARFCSCPRGLDGAGRHRGPHCSAGSYRGALRTASASRLCLDRRLSPLGRPALCMGPRLLAASASPRRRVGRAPLGAPPWRMGAGRRPLAVRQRTRE